MRVELEDVLFDCRDLPGRPEAQVLVNLDFSDATFDDVEFRGCRFENLQLPQTPGRYASQGFPRVALRVLDLLEDKASASIHPEFIPDRSRHSDHDQTPHCGS